MGSYLDQSFGRQSLPQPKVAHDSQYGGNTRNGNRGMARPQSAYDLGGKYGNSLRYIRSASFGFQNDDSRNSTDIHSDNTNR